MTPRTGARVEHGDVPVTSTADCWSMQTLPRIGAPPLRFKGRCLDQHDCDGAQALFVSIWERKKGDFVLAYSDVTDGRIAPHAVAVCSVLEAARHLETKCEAAGHIGALADMRRLPLHGFFLTLVYRQGFADLVGRALADWDARYFLTTSHQLEAS